MKNAEFQNPSYPFLYEYNENRDNWTGMFPDLDPYTDTDRIEDSYEELIQSAREILPLRLERIKQQGYDLPEPSFLETIKAKKDKHQNVVLISVYDNTIERTVKIPAFLDEYAQKQSLDLSEFLRETLLDDLHSREKLAPLIKSNNEKKEPNVAEKPRIERILYIYRNLTKNDMKGFAEDLGVSVATIGRDIQFMKKTLGLPIKYHNDFENGGHYEYDKFRHIADMEPSENDMKALVAKKDYLALFEGNPQYENISFFMADFSRLIVKNMSRLIESRIEIDHSNDDVIDSDIWKIVRIALEKQGSISFDYEKSTAAKSLRKTLEVESLVVDRGMFFLEGHSKENNKKERFRIKNMLNIVILKG